MASTFQMSVIVPHLNEPEDLRRCLQALVSQRTDAISLEIVVVDNGSKAMPVEICGAIPDLRLALETIPGPGPARNLGARLAQSDLLAFVDADCIVQPGWARAVIEAMERHPDVAFVGGDIRVQCDDPHRPSGVECYESVYAYNTRIYVERLGFAATGNMAVRKHVFEAVGPFGGISTMEDTDWGQRATRRGYRGMFVPDAKVLTPSCKNFGELARRWDRHVAHEFKALSGSGSGGMGRWLAKSLLLAASPAPEALRIIMTDRLRGSRSRLLAWLYLFRVRLYRTRRMLSLALAGDASRFVQNWNRDQP